MIVYGKSEVEFVEKKIECRNIKEGGREGRRHSCIKTVNETTTTPNDRRRAAFALRSGHAFARSPPWSRGKLLLQSFCG